MHQIVLIVALMNTLAGNFKTEQLKNTRVKEAYSAKQDYIEKQLTSKNINLPEVEIYLRAFKSEGILEVWAKNKSQNTYQQVLEYTICQSSGILGPKRKEGDLQVPEGFYYINHFNPQSNFHLSLGLNYPNKSDKVFADKNHPGGAIYIHGSCVTIGCIPLTDDKIKELYILSVEARNNGQSQIPVTIFPFKPTPENIAAIKKNHQYPEETLNLWNDLKQAYDLFQKNKKPLHVEFLANGRHSVR